MSLIHFVQAVCHCGAIIDSIITAEVICFFITQLLWITTLENQNLLKMYVVHLISVRNCFALKR